MSGRPRRAAADPGADADADFLALSARQQRAVDRAFERGVRASGRRTRTSKDVGDGSTNGLGGDAGAEDEGGFVVDDEAGGFLPDDGGGFILDDDDGQAGFTTGDEDRGGFIPDDQSAGGFLPDSSGPGRAKSMGEQAAAGSRAKERVPLHLLPGLLGSLGLPCDDDVLAVLKASASGWEEEEEEEEEASGTSGRRGRRGGGEDRGQAVVGVGKKDFRAVCAALLGPDEGDDLPEEDEDEDGDGDEAYRLSGEETSALSDADSASSFGEDEGRKSAREKGKARASTGSARRRARKIKAVDEGPVRLSSRQQEMVADIWKMVKSGSDSGQRGASRILGRDEVKHLVRDLGEMWTDDEITDMVSLFSSQHQGRGLSYQDFGAVMLRAGLV